VNANRQINTTINTAATTVNGTLVSDSSASTFPGISVASGTVEAGNSVDSGGAVDA
jgi:hypothetical protein